MNPDTHNPRLEQLLSLSRDGDACARQDLLLEFGLLFISREAE